MSCELFLAFPELLLELRFALGGFAGCGLLARGILLQLNAKIFNRLCVDVDHVALLLDPLLGVGQHGEVLFLELDTLRLELGQLQLVRLLLRLQHRLDLGGGYGRPVGDLLRRRQDRH